MSSSDDLRSRIEARVAERRTGAGRHARSGPDKTSVRDPTRLPAPARPSVLDRVVVDDAITQQLPRIGAAPSPPSEDRQVRHGSRHRRMRRKLPRGLSFVVRLAVLLLVAATVTLGLRTYVIEPFWIPSQSMEPTLHGCPGCNDDRLLVNKLSYRFHGVHRGDVVVFSRPSTFPTAEKDLIKRVIGLSGETVSGHDGRVWIGNRPLDEPYVAAACNGTAPFAPVSVPSGRVFVMGDNRCDSSDSRVFGPITMSSIVGRAFVVFWPLPRVHWL